MVGDSILGRPSTLGMSTYTKKKLTGVQAKTSTWKDTLIGYINE